MFSIRDTGTDVQEQSAETVLSEDEDDDSKPSNGTTATTSSHDPSAPGMFCLGRWCSIYPTSHHDLG